MEGARVCAVSTVDPPSAEGKDSAEGEDSRNGGGEARPRRYALEGRRAQAGRTRGVQTAEQDVGSRRDASVGCLLEEGRV